MKNWHLSWYDTKALYDRMYALENRVAILESENRALEDILKKRWDRAVESLLPEVQEKCFVKFLSNKEVLVRLLDLEKKLKNNKEKSDET